MSKQKGLFNIWMKQHKGVVAEYRFHPVRRFKFDYAFPDKLLAIEYEGIKGKSRHTTMTGYTRDCEKYNLATTMGWRILRYTALNYHEVLIDLPLALKAKTSTQ